MASNQSESTSISSSELESPYECLHYSSKSCHFTEKNLQGLVHHLNATHKGESRKHMISGPLSFRVICSCGHIGQSGSKCPNCKNRMAILDFILVSNKPKIKVIKHETSVPHPTNSNFVLPIIPPEMIENIRSDPLLAIPKLTVNSKTWRLFGRALQAAFEKAINDDWELLWALPKLILWWPPVKFTARYIKQRIQLLEEGNLVTLYSLWQEEVRPKTNNKNTLKKDEKMTIYRK